MHILCAIHLLCCPLMRTGRAVGKLEPTCMCGDIKEARYKCSHMSASMDSRISLFLNCLIIYLEHFNQAPPSCLAQSTGGTTPPPPPTTTTAAANISRCALDLSQVIGRPKQDSITPNDTHSSPQHTEGRSAPHQLSRGPFSGTMANPGASAQITDMYLSRGVSALAYVEGKLFAGGSFRDANREHGGGLKGASWHSQVGAPR